MRYRSAAVASFVLGAILIAPVSWSDAQDRFSEVRNRQIPGLRQGEVHNPASPRFADHQPNGFARRGHPGHHIDGRGAPTIYPVWYGSPCYDYSYYGGGWCGTPCYPYRRPYYPYFYPPIILPAQALYGPFAGGLFSGATTPLFPGGAFDPVHVVGQGNMGELDAAEALQEELERQNRDLRRDVAREANGVGALKVVPPSSAERQARARRFVTHGDEQFRDGDYRDAAERYRAAAKAAPDLPEVHLRLGQAHLAQGRFDDAAEAFRQASAIQPSFETSQFRLDQIYGRNQVDKRAHFEALANATVNAGHDPDVHYLMGLALYFTGQREQSRGYFRRAAELSAEDAYHSSRFLTEMDRQAAAKIAAENQAAP